MISQQEAERLARDWLKAWNSHDLEAILAHYADDVELTSPFVEQVLGDPQGTLKGKEQVKAYFSMGLAMFPDLHFHLIRVFPGVHSLVVHYRTMDETLAAEVLVLNSKGRIFRVLAHYWVDAA